MVMINVEYQRVYRELQKSTQACKEARRKGSSADSKSVCARTNTDWHFGICNSSDLHCHRIHPRVNDERAVSIAVLVGEFAGVEL